MKSDSVDPREAKLPRWTQDLIKDLRRRAASAEAARDEARLATKPADTDVVIAPYAHTPIGLPPRETVRFYTNRTDELRGWLEVRVRQDGDRHVVEIMGGSTVVIEPRSGNLFYAYPVKR